MTDIAWVAALLSPRSVSPHPNFGSVDLVTPAGLLGLVISGESPRQEKMSDRLVRPLTSAENELIDAASASLQYDTLDGGAERLANLATSSRVPDAAMRVSAALLAAAALGELDELGQAVDMLDQVASRTSNDTDDGRLLRGALMQQQAMRACEAGMPFESARDNAQELLGATEARKVNRYPTSQGSRWPAATTNRNLLLALREANQDLFDSELGFPNTRTLKRLLRTPNSPLASAMIRHAGSGQAAYIEEAYSAFTMSTERSIRAQDPVDYPVWRSLMFFELVGHRRLAHTYRAVLGQLRMLRSQRQPASCREGLRLLRQAGDLKHLKLALGLVRGGGPLAALADEANTIIAHRLSPMLLRDVELATLRESAQVLDLASADAAFNSILAALDELPIVTPFRRDLQSTQYETFFTTAAALAPVAKRVGDLAGKVLDSVERTGPTDDQLLARAHESALRPLDWDEVDETVKDRWRTWLNGHAAGSGDGWDSLVDLVGPELRGDKVPTSRSSTEVSLDRVAYELNAVMSNPQASEHVAAWLRDVASDPIEDRLAKVRRDAAQGAYSMYSIEPANLAVALMQHTGADLWDSVTEYLLDSRVPRRMKTDALNRIAAVPDTVPEFVRRTFASRASSLLSPSDAFAFAPFEPPEIEPYPAAVRALAALGLYSNERLLSALAMLAAGTTASKLEAARTLSTIVATIVPTPEWAVSIALQLSSDPNANVRAETGRTLAVVLQNSEFARDLVERRLLDLLGEDGILVPLLVLRGLSTDVEIARGPIRDRVEDMANHHRVFGVRVQARYALGDLGGSA